MYRTMQNVYPTTYISREVYQKLGTPWSNIKGAVISEASVLT